VKEYSRADRQKESASFENAGRDRHHVRARYGRHACDLRAYQDAREAGELKVRVYCLSECHIAKMIAAAVRRSLGDEWCESAE